MTDHEVEETVGQNPTSRRGFLTAAATTLAALGATRALAAEPVGAGSNPANLPPNVPEWSKVLGDGVAANPYGKPSKYEAHVIRRDVGMAHRLTRKFGQFYAAA